MSLTDHGDQNVTLNFYEELKSSDFNCRMLGKFAPGIYTGGYFTRINDSQITLSAMSLEIRDGASQVSIQTASAATITDATLDGGSLATATPYIVLRWTAAESVTNYFEIHALASIAAAQTYDVIVGKVVFSGAVITGFDYTDRTPIDTYRDFLKVEATAETELYVMLRGGRVQTASAAVVVPDQKVGPFSVPGSPNSRYDLVYLDSNGAPQIAQGTQAPSPSVPNHAGKLVLAQVLVGNGISNIDSSVITDVRTCISTPAVPDGTTVILDANGKLSTPAVGGLFGAWVSRSNNTVYLAATDGFVQIQGGGASVHVRVLSDGSNPPTTVRASMSQSPAAPSNSGVTSAVRRGDFWKAENATTVWWIPLGN